MDGCGLKKICFIYRYYHTYPTNYELSLSVYHGFRTQKTCGKVCAYISPTNFMPQLMRVSYISRVRARLSCGV